ncbi:hypothetical protein [Staphylococcus xylosus]|uniref:hypothetical protein n=1 Tax=Staphylococcus xylosus TaxID=1288 RepID=UPI00142FD1B5|nr:hypothetical protein [Staphylococcus xylosus]
MIFIRSLGTLLVLVIVFIVGYNQYVNGISFQVQFETFINWLAGVGKQIIVND